MRHLNLMQRLPAVLVLTLLAGGVASVAWRFIAPSGDGPLASVTVPTLTDTARAGETVFNANCAACHGENAAGSDKGPPLVHDIYNPGHHDDAAFYRAVKNGTPKHHWNFGDMLPLPAVSETQVRSIIRYVRELQVANGIRFKKHRM